MIRDAKSFHEISFLRVNAAQLRKIASNKPDPISADLHRIAEDWEGRADALEAAAGSHKEVPIAA
jgi:hypothetical protein